MMRERGSVFRKIVNDYGYNMFFLDADIVVLDDLFTLLKPDPELTVQIQVDTAAYIPLKDWKYFKSSGLYCFPSLKCKLY